MIIPYTSYDREKYSNCLVCPLINQYQRSNLPYINPTQLLYGINLKSNTTAYKSTIDPFEEENERLKETINQLRKENAELKNWIGWGVY